MQTILYADCPSGISGDMFLAACLDLGLPLEHLTSELAGLDLSGYRLEAWTELKMGLKAHRLLVSVEEEHHHRAYRDIKAMITGSRLAGEVKSRALSIFDRLARVEASIHGVDLDEVHFHEVGAVDSIVDIVGAGIALEYFQVSRFMASPLPLGSGSINTAHGLLPLPAPATLALLEGIPVYGTGIKAELVTPTGAAILVTQAQEFGSLPAMTVTRTGYGAGTRDLPDRANVMRLFLGASRESLSLEKLLVCETNIDDMNPEYVPFVMDRLFRSGALDVWLTPIQMKKGRPGFTLSILTRPDQRDSLLEIVFAETTTLGIRMFEVNRAALPREGRTVETPLGEVKVKAVLRNGREELIPEYEDCRRLAEETGRPLKEIYDQVRKLADNSR